MKYETKSYNYSKRRQFNELHVFTCTMLHDSPYSPWCDPTL